jgi:hypothetical protein
LLGELLLELVVHGRSRLRGTHGARMDGAHPRTSRMDQGRRAALRGLRRGPAGARDDAGPEALDEPVGRAMAMGAGAGPGGGAAGLPAGGPGPGAQAVRQGARWWRTKAGRSEFRVNAGCGIWGDGGRGLCRRSARIALHARRYPNGDLAGLAVRGLGWSPQGRPAAGRSAVHR